MWNLGSFENVFPKKMNMALLNLYSEFMHMYNLVYHLLVLQFVGVVSAVKINILRDDLLYISMKNMQASRLSKTG